ncbi:cell division protein FtsZ [Stella humosa]|uniref:Cell division protein FtsZ n=1 Tax=Stella humosa TaxID=94 RepID=A0A3N1KU69_9PROT|nr:cell division protein FtsZ [Stella humosa]ROP84121.1 cell division protein FtsZ [Stella humosa]BBK33631.1 cell division protein FtsZ [Stella humosa]
MPINLSVPSHDDVIKPRITVIGVGGAGGNAVNNMIRANLEGVEFVVANTDSQAIAQSLATRKLQLGASVTRGLGAGARPDVGRAAAEEALDELLDQIAGSNMVFITAGMGGGTGTGAGPVIARAAREQGILTIGVVTKPFLFEGTHRMRAAEKGIEELQRFVDTLIIIPNQNLFRIANEKTTFADAFKMADDVLHSGVRGITDLMVMPGLINLDFADIRTVMQEMGKAMMGTGEATGDKRAIDAAEAAISNPLLDDVSMKGAKGVLINITGGLDMTLFEVDEAANRIRDEVDPDANIIFGSTFDEKLSGRMRVSVVATGMDVESAEKPRTVIQLVSDRDRAAQASVAAAEAPAPEPTRVAEPVRSTAGGGGQGSAISLPLGGGGSSLPDSPPPAPRHSEVAQTSYVVESATEMPLSHESQTIHEEVPLRTAAGGGGFGSLIRRVTGLDRPRAPGLPAEKLDPAPMTPARPAAHQAPSHHAPAHHAPAAPSAPTPAPRARATETVERNPPAGAEEDMLDIPAFLRRQAN